VFAPAANHNAANRLVAFDERCRLEQLNDLREANEIERRRVELQFEYAVSLL
jgi:hypothetical protein